jgi:hypothetical protein
MAIYADDLIADKKNQLEKIEDICLPHEVIRAVFDLKGRGTGLLEKKLAKWRIAC